ncbi:MAG TPA: adenosylmethionine decarboxylase [Candidatus Sulfotelmatobacter sp.]|nr:adenosylmethionine decarboxylase [Candidatus Sulfotelmatobacter sp.]
MYRTRRTTRLEVGFSQPNPRSHEQLKALGTHIVCELSGCDAAKLTDVEAVREMMQAAARAANATVIETAFHRFQPQGVSGVVVIQESHLSIHTWPETGYAAMDFYTCGDHTDPWAACQYAAEALDAKQMLTTEVKRGIEASSGRFTHLVTTEHDTRELAATA